MKFKFSVANYYIWALYRDETGRPNRENTSSLLQRYKEHKDLVSYNYFFNMTQNYFYMYLYCSIGLKSGGELLIYYHTGCGKAI